MSTVKIKGTVIIVFALISLIFSDDFSTSIKLMQKQRSYDYQNKLIFSQESFNSQQLAYAIYTNTSNTNIQQCEVFFQNLKSLNIHRSCNITLKNVANSAKPRVILLSNDTILFAYDTQNKNDEIVSITPHFTAIKMDDCTIRNYERYTGYRTNDYSIQPRGENRYDTITMNGDDLGFCRWEHNIEEYEVPGPFDCLAYSVRSRDIKGQQINSELPFMGYIFSRTNSEHWIAVDDKLIRTKFRPPLKGQEIVTSTSNNKISLCSSDNSLTNCWQYDRTGELLNTVALIHGADFGGGVAVYNLKSGGLIVAVGLCEEYCTGYYHIPTYYVSRYNEDGRRMKMRALRNFYCDTDLLYVALKFDKNEEGNICLTMACYGRIPEVSVNSTKLSWRLNLHITSECLDDTFLGSS